MKNRCVIVAGGNCDSECLLNIYESDFVIAADSGLKYTSALNIKPDLIVGDFDSYFGEIPEDIELIELPTEKDDTDLLFAARCGINRCFKDFAVLGGYGTRPDQNFAMLSTLEWLINNGGVSAVAYCSGFEVRYIKNASIIITMNNTRYLSVFAFSGPAFGVSISGAKYCLEDVTVMTDFPIGVSNEADSDVTVSVKNGGLMIMTVDKNI